MAPIASQEFSAVEMLKVGIIATACHAAGAYSIGVPAGRTMARMSAPVMESFHDFKATTLDGKEASMADYKGKPVLILNVASL